MIQDVTHLAGYPDDSEDEEDDQENWYETQDVVATVRRDRYGTIHLEYEPPFDEYAQMATREDEERFWGHN